MAYTPLSKEPISSRSQESIDCALERGRTTLRNLGFHPGGETRLGYGPEPAKTDVCDIYAIGPFVRNGLAYLRIGSGIAQQRLAHHIEYVSGPAVCWRRDGTRAGEQYIFAWLNGYRDPKTSFICVDPDHWLAMSAAVFTLHNTFLAELLYGRFKTAVPSHFHSRVAELSRFCLCSVPSPQRPAESIFRFYEDYLWRDLLVALAADRSGVSLEFRDTCFEYARTIEHTRHISEGDHAEDSP